MSDERTYWYISSKANGRGSCWENKEDAEEERDTELECNPDDEISIESIEMTPEEYEQLPEFEGF